MRQGRVARRRRSEHIRAGFHAGAGVAKPGSPLPAAGYRGNTRVFGLGGAVLDTLVSFAPLPATTTGNIRLHQGVRWFGGGPNGPARAGSDFNFTKLTAELGRTQPL